jgi:hypothetical protein
MLMGTRLLPLSVAELCTHAVELERDAWQRMCGYAARMRELDSLKMADEFDQLARGLAGDVRALEIAAGPKRPVELSPWEYAWRLTYLPDALGAKPKVVPMNPREALQLAALAMRRAESFYRDVEDNAHNQLVRGCAAEMGSAKRTQIQRVEWLLACDARNEHIFGVSADSDNALPS